MKLTTLFTVAAIALTQSVALADSLAERYMRDVLAHSVPPSRSTNRSIIDLGYEHCSNLSNGFSPEYIIKRLASDTHNDHRFDAANKYKLVTYFIVTLASASEHLCPQHKPAMEEFIQKHTR